VHSVESSIKLTSIGREDAFECYYDVEVK